MTEITAVWSVSSHDQHPSKHEKTHLNNISTMLAQRRRRWADVVQMLYKCFVIAETSADEWSMC